MFSFSVDPNHKITAIGEIKLELDFKVEVFVEKTRN